MVMSEVCSEQNAWDVQFLHIIPVQPKLLLALGGKSLWPISRMTMDFSRCRALSCPPGAQHQTSQPQIQQGHRRRERRKRVVSEEPAPKGKGRGRKPSNKQKAEEEVVLAEQTSQVEAPSSPALVAEKPVCKPAVKGSKKTQQAPPGPPQLP
ncbi:hypothetical protein JRQ81_010286 [Phrynocephalus forsythii]|uniref:Uncharacterized protein n=1 Tax=Phrynocephalus forsythii TaxID=171643 RepID=A0A9Q1ARR0_9SAUR|nr:hypothetical protein JRQ81_010286 [Phrynocephalus forsythii]